MEQSITERIEKERIFVIVRGVESEKLPLLAEALYRGGIRFLEVTFRPDGTVSDEDIAADIHRLSEQFRGRMVIGAGTVLTKKQVRMVKRAGGQFIVSPNTDVRVIRATKRAGLVSIPGALTPSEIQTAHLAGADFVKLFPAGVFGANYIKMVKAPLPHVKLLAVGGITLDTVASYRGSGIAGFAVGGAIVDKKRIAENDWDGLAENAALYVKAAQS